MGTDAWTVCTEGVATERNPKQCLIDFVYVVKVCQINAPIMVYELNLSRRYVDRRTVTRTRLD
jgi:hypothetical protein